MAGPRRARGARKRAADAELDISDPSAAVSEVFGFVGFATNTRAVVILLVGLGGGALLVQRHFGTRRAVAICAGAFLGGLAVSLFFAASYAPSLRTGAVHRFVFATLSERRLQLQNDAWTMMLDHPVAGVGVGRFKELSPAVALDPDAPWAHHDFLQYGVEAGLPAFVLLVLFFLWAFPRLTASVHPRTSTTLAAVAVASLGVHACVDFVLQHPPVVSVIAALVGSAVGPLRWPPSRLRDNA